MKKKILSLILVLVLSLSALSIPASAAGSPTIPELINESLDRLETDTLVSTLAEAPPQRIAAIQVGVSAAFIDGKKTAVDTENAKAVPIKKGGRVLIPLRFSATAMGGKAKYISDKDYITVTVGENVARFKINSKKMDILNSKGKVTKTITLDVAATKSNSRVMVPVRAISEGLGCKVFYQKIGSGEYVLISLQKLNAETKEYQIAQLQNLKKYTFADKTKTYTASLPGAWTKGSESSGEAVFYNPLYPYAMMDFAVVSASEAKAVAAMSKSELQSYFEDFTVTSYSKTTINGKKALFFSLTIEDEDLGMSVTFDCCIISSSKAGFFAQFFDFENTYSKSTKEFNTVCKSVKMLK